RRSSGVASRWICRHHCPSRVCARMMYCESQRLQSTDKAPFSVRGRRLKHEWRFLCDLVSLNPRLLSSPEWIPQPPVDSFRFRLHETTGLVQQDSAWAPITEHAAELRFPRFFPAVPMELYLRTPVFH